MWCSVIGFVLVWCFVLVLTLGVYIIIYYTLLLLYLILYSSILPSSFPLLLPIPSFLPSSPSSSDLFPPPLPNLSPIQIYFLSPLFPILCSLPILIYLSIQSIRVGIWISLFIFYLIQHSSIPILLIHFLSFPPLLI